MDVSQYLEIFIEETKEHLQNMNEQILVLEKEPENAECINEIFRAAHSLKGMAGTMGYKKMQHLTHTMEDVFSEVRNGKIKVNAEMVDILFQGLDELQNFLDNIINTSDEGDLINEKLPDMLSAYINGSAPAAPAAEKPAEPAPKKKGGKKAAAAAAAQAEEAKPAEAAPAASGQPAYKDFKFAEHEIKAVEKAQEIGKNVFGATVHIAESCVLKAARAFLVFKNLEPLGDVIKSFPDAQDIEDDKFDFEFSVCIVTSEAMDKVKAAIMSVSEIADVEIGKVELPKTQAEPEKEEEKKTEAPAAAAAKPQAAQNKPAQSTTAKPVVNRSVRVDIEKLDNLMNSVSELIIAKNGLVSISANETNLSNQQGFNEQMEYLERITTELHQSVMKVRMVPIESVVNKFPRMIRDLSKKLDKKMELYMTGEDTELDRTVVDEIGDPLQHLLRNSADHGLEKNEDRILAGKEEVGSIFLNAYQEGNNVVIEVRDDGAGINTDKVKKKAIERGLVSEETAENLSEKEIIDMLFKPGFSTADQITDVSGRGVGLDVVKTKIEALGGDIEAHSKRGEGSSFIIRLPLTLAIIQALMVELGDEKYAIPLGAIETIEDINKNDIMFVQQKEVINLRGVVIPLVNLDNLLDVPKKETDSESVTVVIVRKGDKQAGLVVDSLIGQLEIVIKSIGKYINNSKMISGATILGDGEIALILDVNSLL